MPLDKDKNHVDMDMLEAAMMTARVKEKEIIEKYGYRIKEVDEQEDEIIENYANNPAMNLSKEPSLLECCVIQSTGQSYLNRITAIELSAMRVEAKLSAMQDALMNALRAAMGSAGSADSRAAKAAGCMESINLLLARERSLMRICENVRKNISGNISVASRVEKAIEIEVTHLDGQMVAKELQEETRRRFR
jgi:hypothetical protein